MLNAFQIATLTPGLLQPSIAVATLRAGELGLLDFEYACDQRAVVEAIRRFDAAVRAPFGIKLSGDTPELLAGLISELPNQLRTIVLTSSCPEALREHIRVLRDKNVTTLLEATCLEHAKTGEVIGIDGLVAKGHEAGGRVADETTFILLQRFLGEVTLPVWAYGGIGLHTAAACVAAGAAGIVLDGQLALTRESPFADPLKAKIASMDGSETICLGNQLGETYRIYFRPGNPVVKQLQEIESRLNARLNSEEPDLRERQAEWREAVARLAGWEPEKNALLLGQDAAFATPLAERFRTVGGVLQGIREAVRTHCEAAIRLRPLAEGALLARSNGTRFPILQGPMTRVSDVPEFAARVAEGGALPFLALALMRGPEIRTVLAEAQQRLGALPWGVGILGFVPPELRQEQMDVIGEYRPPFALIAGGRPDHAHALEQKGIPTYLHVPSPGLLKMFVQQGARRFVFEGRECGGHVGPRTSFVLWNQMVDVLLDSVDVGADASEFHVVFAAGIHDALSASMVSVIAAPLAERGMRIGVLLGTAYLFTEEAVASGAISETFQEQARSCRNTVLLETGPGHSTRCVETPYATSFAQEKRRLSTEGRPAEEIRTALEEMNLGRLRIASKGVTRHPKFGHDPAAPKLLEIEKSEQLAQGMYMIGQVAALRQKTCTVDSLHHDVAVEGSNRLNRLTGHTRQARTASPVESPSDVAIIGMSCLLPKAPDMLTYWENILNKVNAVGEIPKDRWDWELYFDSDPKTRDKIYSRWGGFLAEIPFDPMTYGMPPASLRSIEPAQLLTLEVVRAALADAGYLGRPFSRERTSVILGAGGGAADLGLGYGARSFLPVLENLPEFRGRSQEIVDRLGGRLPEWTEDSFAGILTNVSAGRVANRFNLGGSNYTVDAACASSLAAVSLALKELEGQTSDMVIVGGMDTMQNPFTYLCFSKTHALSPRGRCRTFDESADGIAISEGIAIMVFKRLADAERDGDRIYAVIKAAGSSSDGKDRGLTAPRPEGQARALRRAYAKAGFSPATVGLVEAHGTGTVAGDGAEVQALTEVFSEAEASRQGCAIGSVKSMIGHTKCTAGAAGLIKAALALHHKVLPPTLGVEKPNPRARFPETPFFVNTESRPWLASASDHPRRAGVSAFGFGGTNFHVVLEEYKGDPFSSRPAPFRHWPDELFLWKAESRGTLLGSLENWVKGLATEAKPALRDLAYTAWKQVQDSSGGNNGSIQLAIVASSLADLRQKLHSAVEGLKQQDTARINDPRGVYFTQRPLAAEGKLAFLFPGQGSQYPRMFEDVLLLFPEMQEVFERAVRVLAGKLPEPLSTYVFPPPSFSSEEEQQRQEALTRTNIAQPALGAVSLAMFGLLQEFGLQPDMVAGHSYGEYVALAAAGVFSAETLITLSEARGRFIVEGAGADAGTMAAIEAEVAAVVDVLKNFEGVCLANANAPRQSVISGSRAAIARVVEHFTAKGTTARIIPVACAFHSPLVAPAQARLTQFLSTAKAATPRIPVYSNTTAAPYPKDPQAVAERLVEHLVRPVEFVREIESMYEAGARVFVEVGPRGVLTSLTDQILGDRPKLAVASNQSGRPGLTQLLHLLGQLAAQGYALKLDRLYRDRTNRHLDLSALAREYSEKQPAPSAWMVNGARARPLKEISTQSSQPQVKNVPAPVAPSQPAEKPAPRVSVPIHSPAAPVAPDVPRSKNAPTGPPQLESPRAAASAPVSFAADIPTGSTEAASPADQGGVPTVMTHFQRMMTRFLETQKTVMLAYLGAPAETPAAAPSVIAPAHDAPAATSTAEVSYPSYESTTYQSTTVEAHVPAQRDDRGGVVATAASPLPQEAPVSAGLNEKELTVELLAIVSERTGYPPEMLDVNLDLEADLGIDSIKRVEILGTFQQSFAAKGLGVEEGLMEKLTGVRTLQGIIQRVMEELGPRAAAVSAAPLPAIEQPQDVTPPQASAGLDGEAFTAQLLSIVSERTGYPPEMLDLNLDLEADLGIDSIKRVEILGTFQQSFVASGISVEEGLMEKLTGVRTLQGIIQRVMEGLGFRAAEVSAASLPATGQSQEQTHPTASVPLDKEALTSQLLAIVSERTGYPPEMLDLNLDLEADLGIDSIKRVEILGTFQQSFLTSGIRIEEGLMEKLTGVRTLQGIIDRVFQQVEDAPESKRAGAATETPETDRSGPAPVATSSHDAGDVIRRFTLTAVETPLSRRPNGIPKDRTILITDGGAAVTRALADELLAQGYKVALVRPGVRHGGDVQELEIGTYAADLGSPESVTELLALISQRQGPPGGIVHLLALQGNASFAAYDYQGWKDQLRLSVTSLFLIAKAAARHLRDAAADGGASLIAATGMGGTFLTDLPADAEATFPDHGAVAGLAKTLALEWPDVGVKVVDLNLEQSAQQLARHLVEELNAGSEHVEVGYDGDRRITLSLTQAPLQGEAPAALVLDSSSVVLITGGARGITALAARRLAELYQPTLVLAGRSSLPDPDEAAETAGITTPKELKAALMNQMRGRRETVTPALVERAYARLVGEREIRGNLIALRQLGARVSYYSVDVRDAEVFGSFIDDIYSSFGRLDGVIHGAGVIEDKLVQDKTPESFDRVFDTKADSAFVLSRKLRPESLKFLVFFSSVSGRFGNRGQGDYAAANEILNKVAVCLDRAWPGRVVAMNWGPWDTEGMVSAEVRKQFAERGVELISSAIGLRRLEEELKYGRRGESEVVIGGATWQPPIRRSAHHRNWPLLGPAAASGSNGHRELIREINPAYDLYLRDHQLDGQPVLPLAMATELMAEAVAQGWQDMQVVAVRDLRMFQGIVLDGVGKTVRVVAKAQAGEGANPASVAVEVVGTGQPHRTHYRATIDLAERLPDAPSFNLPPLADGRPFHMKVEEIYDRWLFHGPLFQGITEVNLVGASGVRAMLATTSPTGWFEGVSAGQWLIDPLMFDSALQLLVLWARENWDMTALPSGFQSYRRFAAPSASRIVCEMRIRPNTGGQTIHADIFFLDAATGRIVSILDDMQGACSKALNRLSERKTLAAAGRQ